MTYPSPLFFLFFFFPFSSVRGTVRDEPVAPSLFFVDEMPRVARARPLPDGCTVFFPSSFFLFFFFFFEIEGAWQAAKIDVGSTFSLFPLLSSFFFFFFFFSHRQRYRRPKVTNYSSPFSFFSRFFFSPLSRFCVFDVVLEESGSRPPSLPFFLKE